MRYFTELTVFSTDKDKAEMEILSIWSIEMETTKELYALAHNGNNETAKERLENLL